MKIVVCIKQVPDTTEVKLDPVTGTLIRDGVPSIINPDDKSGLEAALALKDEHDAHVTVLTMGPPQADIALREALAMGADEAILLTDRKFAGADTLATSTTLAAAIRKLKCDLVIAGRQAIDGDTALIGAPYDDDNGDRSGSVYVWGPNRPPNKPTIDGPTTGKAGVSYKYTFTTIEPDEDQVYYYVDWRYISTGLVWAF